jgi:hypothetical protein
VIRGVLLAALAAGPAAAQACFTSPRDPTIDFRVTADRGTLKAFNSGGSAFCVLKLDCAVRPSATGMVFVMKADKPDSLGNVTAIRFRFADKSEQGCGVVSAAIAIPPAPGPQIDPALKGFSAPKKP